VRLEVDFFQSFCDFRTFWHSNLEAFWDKSHEKMRLKSMMIFYYYFGPRHTFPVASAAWGAHFWGHGKTTIGYPQVRFYIGFALFSLSLVPTALGGGGHNYNKTTLQLTNLQ